MQNRKLLASILLVLISAVCVAQNEPPPPGPPVPPGLPIDGFVMVGLFVGLFYGVKRHFKNNR